MLTTQDIEKAANDERWLGFGYLGGRRTMLTSTDPEAPADAALVAVVDEQLIAYANVHGWDYEDLFAWANSKNGRWFADSMFSGSTFEKAIGWGLLAKVSA